MEHQNNLDQTLLIMIFLLYVFLLWLWSSRLEQFHFDNLVEYILESSSDSTATSVYLQRTISRLSLYHRYLPDCEYDNPPVR